MVPLLSGRRVVATSICTVRLDTNIVLGQHIQTIWLNASLAFCIMFRPHFSRLVSSVTASNSSVSSVATSNGIGAWDGGGCQSSIVEVEGTEDGEGTYM